VSNIPIRFSRGQGLEAAANEQTQAGLLELRNTKLDLREVIEKRQGSEQIAMTIGADPEDVLDAEGISTVAYREKELCIWSDRTLYSRSQVQATTETTVPVGVATDQQIDAAKGRAAAELGDPSVSFDLPGHPDAGLISFFGSPTPVRPSNQSDTSAPSGIAATILLVGGAVRILVTLTSGTVLQETVETSGGSDVRIVFAREDDFQGLADPEWIASWRQGASVKWAVVKLIPNSAATGYIGISVDLLQTLAVANRPYDLKVVGTNPSAVGTTLTLYFCPTTTTITARSISLSTMLPALDRTITTSFSIATTDLIIAVREQLPVNAQTAAYFRRPTGGRHEYWPLRFDSVVSQDGIAIPTIPDARRPEVIRATAGDVQLVGIRDVDGVGIPVSILVGAPGSAPQWVGIKNGATSESITTTHTVQAVETPTAWEIRRNGTPLFLETFASASTRRFLKSFGGIIVGVRTPAGSLQRQAWTPLTDGPYSDYVTISAATGHVSLDTSAGRIAYIFRPTTASVRVASSANGAAWNEGTAEGLTITGGVFDEAAGALIITADTGSDTVTATWYYRIGSNMIRRTVSTTDPVQGSALSIAAAPGPIYAEDIGVIDLVVVGQNPFTTYEFGSSYAVQVDPRLLALQAGNFSTRGAWTPSRLRQESPIESAGGGTVVACDVGEIDGIRILLWQVSGGTAPGIYVSVYSDHFELVGGVERIDSAGTRPRVVVNHADGSAYLTYLSAANVVQHARWTTSTSAISFSSTGITATSSMYQTLSASTETGSPRHKFVLIAYNGTNSTRITRYDASTLASLHNELYGFGTPGAFNYGACVESEGLDFFRIRVVFPGAAGISTFRINLGNAAGGSVLASSANSFTIAPASVARLAVASPDGTSNYHLLIERTDQGGVNVASNDTTEPANFRRHYRNHAIWSSAVRHSAGRTYAVLSGGRGSSNNNTSSYFVLDLSTLEIISRTFVAEGEVAQTSRLTSVHLDLASTSLTRDEDRLVFVAAVQCRWAAEGAAIR
jgi:hypothetical protein